MTTEDIFRRITGALESAKIPYMLTGSFASSFYGATRATRDIDLVIAPTPQQLRDLIRQLPETEYYVNLEGALDAMSHESQFNVIDMATGWKVDMICRKSRPFSREEFDRRSPVDLHGVRVFVATAEDVVLSKLEWGKSGGSQRQIEDVAGIIRLRSNLDRPYLERWVRDLQLEPQWQAARALAGEGRGPV